MTKEQLLKEFREYAATLDDSFRDEWYTTEKKLWEHMFMNFIDWKFGQD